LTEQRTNRCRAFCIRGICCRLLQFKKRPLDLTERRPEGFPVAHVRGRADLFLGVIQAVELDRPGIEHGVFSIASHLLALLRLFLRLRVIDERPGLRVRGAFVESCGRGLRSQGEEENAHQDSDDASP
jgi:hypothetical protein